MKTIAYRIVEKLIEAGIEFPGGPENAEIRRTRAGRHQRSCGAWSFFLWCKDGSHLYPMIGSQYPASLIAKGFTVYRSPWADINLDPINP